MKPVVTLITLGVDDLERAVRFYRDGLGLQTPGIVGEQFETGAVAFFDLQSGLRLALWARKNLVADAGLPLAAPAVTDFCLAHNVARKDEVDEVMSEAAAAGAVIVKSLRRLSGAATPATSTTPTGTCGKSPGTRRCCRTNKQCPAAANANGRAA